VSSLALLLGGGGDMGRWRSCVGVLGGLRADGVSGRGLREGERGRERGSLGRLPEDGGRCPSRLPLLPDT